MPISRQYYDQQKIFDWSVDGKTALFKHISKKLRVKFKRNKINELDDFCIKHQDLTGSAKVAFRYKSKLYYLSTYNTSKDHKVPEPYQVSRLHESLEEAFEEFLQRTGMWEGRQNIVDGLIVAAITAAGNAADLFNLLPKQLHEHIAPSIYEPSISPEGVAIFHKENDAAIQIAKAQHVLNLLME